ncbi:MAG: ribosome-associated translation inhibitor RaiA [Anaerolineaceae bacterium]
MDLNVDINTKNLELTDHISEYVTKKVSKLDRFLTDIDEARVDLAFSKTARSNADRQVAQITLRGKGFILRAEERADDLFAAIDAAVEKIQRQIARLKGKRDRGRGDGKTAADVVIVEPVIQDEEEEPVIARRKEFTIIPMNELEAIEQMKLLGHENFFIFYNANSGAINVLYHRRDGTYGLIEPKVR